MYRPPWIRVVLWLVCAGVPGLSARPFTPLAVPITLPDALHGKAVWALTRLPDGRLAAGFEGGVALGLPGGPWSIVAAPNGSPVQLIAAAHGRLLVAGGGCAGFVETGTFQPIAGLQGQIVAVHIVPEGWLLTGPAGLWFVAPDGPARRLAGSTGTPPVVGKWKHTTVLLQSSAGPSRWQEGRLVPSDPGEPLAAGDTRLLRDGLCFTEHGVFGPQSAEPLLPAAAARSLLNEAGLIGMATGEPWLLFATYWRGLLAYRPGTDIPEWTWPGPGNCYTFSRDGAGLLAGTAEGAFGLADPNLVRIARCDSTEILHLQAEPGGARLVTLDGALETGTLAPAPADQLWPETDGAVVTAGVLHFRDRAIRLPTRYINGLAVCGETAAVAYGTTLLFAGRDAPVLHELPGGVSSLEATGTGFLVGTQDSGILSFDTAGHARPSIGTGRARVRAVAPGQLVLLFWNGEVRSAHDEPLARLPFGNPRDAALVAVRNNDGLLQTARLAVLVTRPDGPPSLGLADRDAWTPLEIPGLAEIDAEALAATGDRLYVAGRRGVLEVRMPLGPAAAPLAAWRWEGGGRGAQLELPGGGSDRALLVPGRWEAPPFSGTRYQLRRGDERWTGIESGVPVALPADWGRNAFTLRAERNGQVDERALVVVRPYPIPLRPWALALEAAAFVAAVWGLSRWRTRRLLAQKQALETAVEERTAQLRKANAAKEEFLASVSHEIRNPLNGVVGVCAILEDSPVGPREKSFVRVLSGCAEQLRSMLDDVLDFSRIERGEVALALAPFEIRALVEEAVRVMDPPLAACSLELPDTAQWLEGDAGKLRQIVCNLVSNALKYGRPSEAGIELRLQPEPEQRVRIRLAVRNTGPTIPPDELPRLFDSFRRGSATGHTPGFGLGLAVCRRLAERMGGRMTAASTEGQTEFALELTLALAAPPAARAATPAAVSHALAVEDEEYNRLALGHALRALGYEIDWAIDGASALQLARRQAYDLVLTDWRLPDIEGDELCRQLLAVLPPPRPPVIAVTAYSSEEKLAAARAAGMAGFVTKPVTREKLAHAIRELDTGPRPRPALDLIQPPGRHSALGLLGELAPTLARLSVDLATGWQQTRAQTRLRDPRAGRAAHGLRSLLLLAGENDLAEQLGLLEAAADASDWETADRLLPFLDGEIEAARNRLSAGR